MFWGLLTSAGTLIGRRPHPPVQTEVTNADCLFHWREEAAFWDPMKAQQWIWCWCSLNSFICLNSGNSDSLLSRMTKRVTLHPASVYLHVCERPFKKTPLLLFRRMRAQPHTLGGTSSKASMFNSRPVCPKSPPGTHFCSRGGGAHAANTASRIAGVKIQESSAAHLLLFASATLTFQAFRSHA